MALAPVLTRRRVVGHDVVQTVQTPVQLVQSILQDGQSGFCMGQSVLRVGHTLVQLGQVALQNSQPSVQLVDWVEQRETQQITSFRNVLGRDTRPNRRAGKVSVQNLVIAGWCGSGS